MAVIKYVYDPSSRTVTWSNMASGDTGQYYQMHSTDNTIHAFSSSWSSSTMTLFGSNDPRAAFNAPDSGSASWVEVKDNSNTGIAFSADDIATMVTAPRFVSPEITSGSATSVTVVIREGNFLS